MRTEPSDVQIDAVLSQMHEAEGDHPIAFFSRKLLPQEKNYPAVEKG